MSRSIRNNAISAMFWRLLERGGTQLVTLIVQIVLARLLLPEEFGLIAIVMVFVSLSTVLVQSGLNVAIMRWKSISENDCTTVFWMSFCVAIILYIAIFLSSPHIAEFYEMPLLESVLRILSLILLPGAYNSVQIAVLMRNLLFKRLLIGNLAGIVLSAIIGCTLASWGYGVWSLVAQQLSNQFIVCILLAFFVKWKPSFCFNWKSARSFFSFGWKIMVSKLIDKFYSGLADLLIGKAFSSASLGFYSQGKKYPYALEDTLDSSIQSVMLPTLSRFQDDRSQMRNAMRRTIQSATYVIAPIMLCVAAAAEPIVEMLLTEKWLGCVPYFRIFCVICALRPMNTANLQGINALGRSDIYLKLEILKKCFGFIVLFAALLVFNSPLGIAVGMLVSNIANYLFNSYPNTKLLNYGLLQQIRDVIPSYLFAFATAIAVALICTIQIESVYKLVLTVIAAPTTYFLLSYFFKTEASRYVYKAAKSFVQDKIKHSGD